MNNPNNVTIEDIKDIEGNVGIALTDIQRVSVLNEYNRVCMDKGESWNEILNELIKGYIKG